MGRLNIDIDGRKCAEAALLESEERYRRLFESMDEAYAVVEVTKDAVGNWVDFRFLDANRAFMEHTSMPLSGGSNGNGIAWITQPALDGALRPSPRYQVRRSSSLKR